MQVSKKWLQTYFDQKLPEAERIADLLDEITHLNHIIESLLFIAKADSGALVLCLKTQPIAEFITPLLEDIRLLAGDRGVRFTARTEGDGQVRLEPKFMRQLLFNLVGNALNVAPAGSEIVLESAPTPTGWRFAVVDEGPGLPEAQLGRIFERFVRFQHGKGTPGTGLGLAICRSIADLHGGKIHAENRTDRKGLRVVVEV